MSMPSREFPERRSRRMQRLDEDNSGTVEYDQQGPRGASYSFFRGSVDLWIWVWEENFGWEEN